MRISNDPTTVSEDLEADSQNSKGADSKGPLLLKDRPLIEKLARFNRKRIREGAAHPFDSGACGVFEVTNPEVPRWTRARMFSEAGKRTEVFVRFSTAGRSKDIADAVHKLRGFAVRFYTEDGGWDLDGSNSPVSFIRDPLKLPHFIHSQKTDPRTGRQDVDNVWEFFSHSPEATHQITWLFGDRGLPRSWRHMDGYAAHTFQWINAAGERVWVKFHFKTDQGVECFGAKEAARNASEDPGHLRRDLHRALEGGNFPSWTLNVQIMPEADAAGFRIDPFDPTKVWPHSDYPLIEVGRMTLSRLPENHVAGVEQSGFDPGHMVPGVGPSPDRMLQARLFAYGDAQRCRLGIARSRLPVNNPLIRPFCRSWVHGPDSIGGRAANDEPGGLDSRIGTGEPRRAGMENGGLAGNCERGVREVDDFAQAGALYRLMSEAEKEGLIAAIAGSLSQVRQTATGDSIVCRSIGHLCRADRDYGRRVALAVKALRGGVRTAALRARKAAAVQS